jgi:hypothetical protein
MNSAWINNLRDPSLAQDAATRNYVDNSINIVKSAVTTATTNMATTDYVTTELGINGTMLNSPSVYRNDNYNGFVYLAGVGGNGNNSPSIADEVTGRCNLYIDNNLFYAPNTNTLYGGKFTGTATYASILSNDNGQVQILSGGGEIMRIASTGRVGINTTAPEVPLDIVGGVNQTLSCNGYTGTGNNLTIFTNGVFSVALKCQGSIRLGGNILFSSDKRIKKNVKDIDGNTALSQIRQIRPKIYNYIDYTTKGNGNVYGFIAQDVKDVILHSTMCTKEYIPNFYCQGNICVIDASNYIYEISSENDLLFEKVIDDSGNEVLFHKVKIYAYDSSDYICSVIQVNNPKNIRVKLEKEYKFANDEENKYKLFIYGQQIYDFHSLENNSVWTVATAALQEVDRQQQADKVRIAELEAKVAEQQSLINDILERLKKVGA